MPSIRHVCAGHEYRCDTETGAVHNNYGRHVASVRICRFTGKTLLYKVDAHWPKIYASDLISHAPAGLTDAQIAEFAIGQCAAHGIGL